MKRMQALLLAAAIVGAVSVATASAMHFSPWSTAQKIDEISGNSSELNTAFQDGCPIESPDGLSLYMASNRPGGHGLLDIWVARRASKHEPFGDPEDLGAPVNSAADDFCPTPVRGNGLFFVSRRSGPGTCGLGDIYFTRFNRVHGWSEPEHLACAPEGPNTALDEQGPSYFEADGEGYLYFSSSSAAVPGDIYASRQGANGSFGPAAPVSELNSAGNDIQPNVRKDGLEVVFSSPGASGGQDIYAATRKSTSAAWSAPVNLGSAVNTAAGETRPSLSWNGRHLLFGRAPGPEGSGDIYLSTRTKNAGKQR